MDMNILHFATTLMLLTRKLKKKVLAQLDVFIKLIGSFCSCLIYQFLFKHFSNNTIERVMSKVVCHNIHLGWYWVHC